MFYVFVVCFVGGRWGGGRGGYLGRHLGNFSRKFGPEAWSFPLPPVARRRLCLPLGHCHLAFGWVNHCLPLPLVEPAAFAPDRVGSLRTRLADIRCAPRGCRLPMLTSESWRRYMFFVSCPSSQRKPRRRIGCRSLEVFDGAYRRALSVCRAKTPPRQRKSTSM